MKEEKASDRFEMRSCSFMLVVIEHTLKQENRRIGK